MQLLLVPVPLFDKYLTVDAYLLRYKIIGQDSARSYLNAQAPLLKALYSNSMEAFGGGRPVIVPVTFPLMKEIVEHSNVSGHLITFLLEDIVTPTAEEMAELRELKQRGFHFAVNHDTAYIGSDELLQMSDSVLFSEAAMQNEDRRAMNIRYKDSSKYIKTAATMIEDMSEFELAMAEKFDLFEGKFYRIPISRSDRELTPIKSNLLQLMNLVRDEDFEFKDIADVMRRDPALSYSLMRFINSPYLGIRYKVKSIQHAVTILGQQEVRKWITAVVFKEFGSDRPSELMRISMVRGKFAENLAASFGMGDESQSLFLMGMFSALDTMLNTDMATALSRVMVSDDISNALIKGKGRYAPILKIFIDYERADWDAVMEHCEERKIPLEKIFQSYMDSVSWYNDLVNSKSRLQRGYGE